MKSRLLVLLVQLLMSLLAIAALLLALALADGEPVPAVAAVVVCCWAVQKAHSATFGHRHGGKHA